MRWMDLCEFSVDFMPLVFSRHDVEWLCELASGEPMPHSKCARCLRSMERYRMVKRVDMRGCKYFQDSHGRRSWTIWTFPEVEWE